MRKLNASVLAHVEAFFASEMYGEQLVRVLAEGLPRTGHHQTPDGRSMRRSVCSPSPLAEIAVSVPLS
jgi:hypothetical protein